MTNTNRPTKTEKKEALALVGYLLAKSCVSLDKNSAITSGIRNEMKQTYDNTAMVLGIFDAYCLDMSIIRNDPAEISNQADEYAKNFNR